MNRYRLSACMTSICALLVVGKCDACDLPPIPDINNVYCQYICVGGTAEFDGTTSYDQDEDGNSVEHWYWWYGDDESWHDDGSTPTHTYDTSGQCRVGEEVSLLTPHRPGLADFPHPVPHLAASLRDCSRTSERYVAVATPGVGAFR